MPKTDLTYKNAAGELGELSGKANTPPGQQETGPWVDQRHRMHATWTDTEARSRASYIATRTALRDFLVPHRFEGDTSPRKLRRSKLGFGLRLNAIWLADIFGHIRSAPASYWWGPLAPGDARTTGEPEGGKAKWLWQDATMQGKGWTNFMEGRVLEWLLSSPGGFILVDGAAEGASGLGDRPRLVFIPWSWVTDVGRDRHGYAYIRAVELVDNLDPRAKGKDRDPQVRHVLFALDGPTTVVTRYDGKGEQVGEAVAMGEFVDRQDQATLPLIPVGYGEHEDAEWLGAGLLRGLDDIVIDAFNLMSETREGFRDVSFGALVHKGPGGDVIEDALREGSRFFDLGDNANSELSRLAAESSEVSAGMGLVRLTLEVWAMSAKRKVAEAMERADPSSGVKLKAEFQLDLAPLLVEVAETLDGIESDVMFMAGQVSGLSADQVRDMGVTRGTEFQLEDEASRIARIMEEGAGAALLGLVPAEAKAAAAMAWIEAARLVDLDAEVTLADGSTQSLRDYLPDRALELARLEEQGTRRRAEGAGFGGFGGIL